MLKTFVTIIALSAASVAAASTPAEWAALDKRVNGACIAMSRLQYPTISQTPIRFSDAIGIEARMIRGYNVVRGRRVNQRLLCAYNRATGRAEVQEAQAWWAVR